MDSAQLTDVFHALADETRRDMVARLATSSYTVGELAEPYPISFPAITKHLNVLENAGLVSKRRSGKFVHCQLEADAFASAVDWITEQRNYWEAQLESFGTFLEKHTKPNRPRSPKEK